LRRAPGTAVLERRELGHESLRLLQPLVDDRARRDDQHRLLLVSRDLACEPPRLEVREHLHGLAEAHVVGEATADAGFAEGLEPAERCALVVAQLAAEGVGWRERGALLEPLRARAHELERLRLVVFDARVAARRAPEPRIEQPNL